MDNAFPQVDVLANNPSFNAPPRLKKPWYTIRRLLVFLVTFLLAAGLSLSYVYNRPALYKSQATLLTVAQTAVDQQSSEADVQHVAIQRQILMGEPLLNETLERLDQSEEQGYSLEGKLFLASLTAAELREMLTVNVVPETNLVELSAAGHYADTLAPIINTWVVVYLQRRAEEFKQSTQLTTQVLYEELDGLEDKGLIKRAELEGFRKDNDITSLGRENIFENEALAHFRGLNQSLTAANNKVIKSKAVVDAVKLAIKDGQLVASKEGQGEIRQLGLRLQKLQEQLTEFDKKYTRDYLALNPSLNVLPQQIKDLREEIQKKRQQGQQLVVTVAERNHRAAKQTLSEIKRQLAEHKQQAGAFSSKFSVHESLLADLEGLELLQREAQERLTQIEAKQAEKFPQVNVIQRAFLPHNAFSPDYLRDAIIAICSSLLLGLFAVWLVDFLTRNDVHTSTISMTGTGEYPYKDMPADLISAYAANNAQLAKENSPAPLAYAVESVAQLEQTAPMTLSLSDLEDLLEASDIHAKQLISLLLSGVSVDEIRQFNQDNLDFASENIILKGNNPRQIAMNGVINTLFEHIQPCPVWHKSEPVELDTLESILRYTAVDAGLEYAQQVTMQSISDVYILYLVRQGVRLSELKAIVGDLPPTALSEYSQYSPATKGVAMTDINLLYPALEKYID